MPTELRGIILDRAERAGHVVFVDQLEELAAAEQVAARDLFGLLTALVGKDGAAVLRVVATVWQPFCFIRTYVTPGPRRSEPSRGTVPCRSVR